MSRMKYLKIGSINVVMHPHERGSYIRLFKFIYSNRIKAKYWGNRSGIIGSLRDIEWGRGSAISGEFFFYTDIDLEQPWLDLDDRDEADVEDLEEIFIPDHLRPEMKRCRYFLVDQGHTLFFMVKTEAGDNFGPKAMGNFIAGLMGDPKVYEEYGDVEVTINPEKEVLDRIFSMPHMSKLSLLIKKPNPDDLDDIEEEVIEELEQNNSGRKYIEYSAASRNSSLTPTNKTRALAQVAASNGMVKAVGKLEDGEPVEESTEFHPEIHSLSYRDDGRGPFTALLEYIRDIVIN